MIRILRDLKLRDKVWEPLSNWVRLVLIVAVML